MMETQSETDFSHVINGGFSPNYFVDVTETIDDKLRALSIYESEISSHPFPRSEEGVKALATVRGAVAGCRYAESFMILRELG